MSRRASLFAKENAGKKPKGVRFPDELVFLDNIKENDMEATYSMLRRASVHININSVYEHSGVTPLHQAVLDDNLVAVRLLVRHGADVNVQDEDTWTPLHAACADGHADIARYLLSKGADRDILTDEGERPIDLVDPGDLPILQVMLSDGAAHTTTVVDESEDESDEDDEEQTRDRRTAWNKTKNGPT